MNNIWKFEEIVQKEDIPLRKETIEVSSEFNNKDLMEELLKNNHLYRERIEVGKKIATILDRGVIWEELLTKEHYFGAASFL